MTDLFLTYIRNRIQDVPWYVYVLLLLFFCVGAVLLTYRYGLKRSRRYLGLWLLSEYVLLLVSSTVLFRSYNLKQKHDFRPFWSYSALLEGEHIILPEIIMNIVVFAPVGFLLRCGFRRIKWWQVMLIGLLVSTSIEVLQLVFNRGFTELDDMMHNTIGCMAGYALFLLLRYAYVQLIHRR